MPAERVADEPDQGWLASLRVYLDRRQALIFLMGFSSGLPLLLTLSTLTYWLSTLGVDKTEIGLFLLTGLPYSFKFLWAPVMDRVALPLLTPRLGRRRSWALVSQAGLIVAILALGATDPTVNPWSTACAALVIAFLSASQDIAIDAYRIEVLAEHEQGAGAASTQYGYRIGLLAAGAGAIALSDFLGWFWVFAAMAGLVSIGMATVLAAPRTAADEAFAGEPAGGDRGLAAARAWLEKAVLDPLADFLGRPGWAVILGFILLYKFGDAIGGSMANPFYHEMGFDGVEIASVTKVFGLAATLAGIFAGGLAVARMGILRALVIGGILQALANLLFAVQALLGHDIAMLAVSIGVDNFTGGLGSAAFVAYLSSLCNVAFTGTQYALLTSLMAAGRTALSSGGGWLADQVDWVTFFVLTTGLAIPGLLLLWLLLRRYPLPVRVAAP